MRTPVVLICGQGDTDGVVDAVATQPGTVVVEHRFDGQVVLRRVCVGGDTSEWPLELKKGCVTCTVRNDLLILLRRLHRRSDVDRVVVRLMPWLEPEPVCWAINNIRVRVGPGYLDGPAACDVRIEAVVTCVDTTCWLSQSLGDDELADGRTVAQVVVSQAEFADALVLTDPDTRTLAVLRRLAPLARLTVGAGRAETALANLEPDSRRGHSDNPHDPLLVGEPSLSTDGDVGLILFSARRPFHPERLHDSLDLLLDGVVRTRGRLWLANRFDNAMWIESAGCGLRTEYAGKWLAAMTSNQLAYADPQRCALASADWDDVVGDRHVALTVLVCGADPEAVAEGLQAALLTDEEMARPHRWPTYTDPFGDWHHDPCEDKAEHAGDVIGKHEGDER